MSSFTEPKGLDTDAESTTAVPWNQQFNVSDIMCLQRKSVIACTTYGEEDMKMHTHGRLASQQTLHLNKDIQRVLDPTLLELLDGQTIKYHYNRVATSHAEGSLLKDGSTSHDVLLALPSSYSKAELPSFTEPPGRRPSIRDAVAVTYLVEQPDSTHKVRAVTDLEAEVDGYHKGAMIDVSRHENPKPFSMKLTSRVLNGIPSSKQYTYDPDQTSFEIVQPSVEYLDSMFSTLAIGKHVSPEARKIYEATKKRLTTEDETVPDQCKVISWWLGPLVKDEHGRPLYSHDRDTGVTTQRRKITYYIPYNEAEHHDEAYPETESEKPENSTQS